MGNTSFGSLIKQLRQEHDLSLDQLAEITTLSKSYLSRIENDERRNPTIFAIIRIKSALNMDIKMIEKLFSDEDDGQEGEGIESIDSILLNGAYKFCDKVATMDVKLSLKDMIKQLEKYAVKETVNRDDDANLLQLADKLRSALKSA